MDPDIGPMTSRAVAYNIATHSKATLMTGLARYAPRKTAALVTYVGARESCSWLISARGIEAYARTSIGSAAVRARVRNVLAALKVEGAGLQRSPRRRNAPAAAALPQSDTPPLGAALAAMAEVVAPGPVSAALAQFDSVIIAPDAALFAFPFALTPIATAGGPKPLIDLAAIQLAPALGEIGLGVGLHRARETSLEFMTLEARRAALSKALVVGDPVYADAEYELPQLAGAAAEANEVARQLNVTPVLGASARRARIMEGLKYVNRPRYVHFATHGLSDMVDAQANQSFLALAGGDRFDAQAIGTLRMTDGAIVVLSACQTGLGASRPGGVMGLPRLFQFRNAETVLMSLWNVNDAATQHMMTSYVAALIETGRPVHAHRLAMLSTRAAYPDPAHWASFMVFGAGRF
jgi:hypothetical protein